MPSPFPGMDPFLEHPSFFPDLHDSMNVYLREALQARLPEPYFAVINERLWVETFERFVEIRTRTKDGDERIVTTIEVLSLANKIGGEKGRELYLRKQKEVLDGEIHLVEIDLLRDGEHTTAPPRWRIDRKAGPFDYHVSIHLFDNIEDYFIYPIRLEDPLPEIAIPLLPGDGAVPLDLQAVLDRCYAVGPYSRRVKYDVSRLVPPFPAKQTRWVKQRLREAKLAP
jgi:hypothetical protein